MTPTHRHLPVYTAWWGGGGGAMWGGMVKNDVVLDKDDSKACSFKIVRSSFTRFCLSPSTLF
jgi:hypothetical protein